MAVLAKLKSSEEIKPHQIQEINFNNYSNEDEIIIDGYSSDDGLNFILKVKRKELVKVLRCFDY